MRHPLRASLLVLAGLVLTQVAWLWVVPPFGGMDEFDHAYRAASVARGHLTDRSPAEKGRGDLIIVPADIVRAAHHRCAVLPYTGWGNCNASTAPDHAGNVEVASAAARYNPAYYAVVGTVARPFRGVAALYAMRATTLVLCDLFLLIALYVAFAASRGPWPVAGLVVASTPVLLCATTIAAPNGVEMAAGLTAWTAALALINGGTAGAMTTRALTWVTTGALTAVVVTHSLGVMWAGLSLTVMAALAGRERLAKMWREHRRPVLTQGGLLGVVTLASVLWTVSQATNSPAQDADSSGPLPMVGLLRQPIAWVIQTIGTVPFRNQLAPPLVFAVGLVGFVILLVLGLRRAKARARWAAAGIAAVSLLIPLVLTALTFNQLGFAWQGRYGLPFAYGMIAITSWAIDSGKPSRFGPGLIVLLLLGFATMQMLSLAHVRTSDHWSSLDGGIAPPVALLVVLSLVGAVLMATGVASRRTRAASVTHEYCPVKVAA